MRQRGAAYALSLFLAATLSGCPRPATTGATSHQADPATSTAAPGGSAAPVLEPIPAPLDAKLVPPEQGNDPSAKSPLIDLMAAENQRWFEKLRDAQPAPAHFIGYTIRERRSVSIEAEDGVLTDDDDDTQRALDVDVRVGTPQLDSRHQIKDERAAAIASLARIGTVPFGTDPEAIRRALWLETDRRYREGLFLLNLIKTERRVGAGPAHEPPDFSVEKPSVFYQKKATLEYDRTAWIKKVRDCSRRAARGVATRSSCRADFELDTVYYVNSEGSRIQTSGTTARFMVQVGVKHDDGMPLSRVEQAFAPTPAQLPGDKRIDQMITVVNRDLQALHDAPRADPFVGPAILEGRAAAVFFHEVFGHRIEGHRQKDDTEGQTFTKKVGEQIMPAWLSIYDDPTIRTLNGIPLNGFYRFDDEGVKAQRANLVKDGVLEGFDMGRNPFPGFPHSNGHGRDEPGYQPVSRQGNLVVATKRSVTKDELFKQLLAEIKRQHKPYGYMFTDISGGYTNTTRFSPQAFKVNPIMTYRVYPDGRTEVVRGLDISGSPLTALGNIISAARPIETFNGVCGAESGWVPVSASAPSLLLRTLEVERQFSPQDRGPVLPPPSVRSVSPRASAGGAR